MFENYIFLLVYSKEKLYKFLSNDYFLNISFICKMIKKKQIYINGKVVKNHNCYVNSGDKITIRKELTLPKIQFYQDENIILVNKPSGIGTHGGKNCFKNIINILNNYKKLMNCKYDLHPVHRLDKDTSGLLIIAKKLSVAKIFDMQFKNHSVFKEYILIIPKISYDFWNVQCNINEDNSFNWDCSVKYENDCTWDQVKYNSCTRFLKIKDVGPYSIVKAQPITGKNHQIRIHCKLIKSPILGDILYGGEEYHRLCLHNYKSIFQINNMHYQVTIPCVTINNFIDIDKMEK